MAHRWPCSVPGCRCTVAMSEPHVWPGSWALCRKHWPTLPKMWRRAVKRADKRRLATEYGSEAEAAAKRAYDRLVKRVLRYAIEQATGIS